MSSSAVPIRVLHLCQRDDPKTGGALQVASLLVQYLADVCDINAKLLFLYGPPGPVAKRLPDRCDYLGLTSSMDVPIQGCRILRQFKSVDIAHHHDMITWSNLASILAPKVKRVMHGHVAAGVRSFGWRTRLANRVQTTQLAKLIAITENVAESWKAEGVPADTVTVIGNAIDTDRFRRRAQHRQRIRQDFLFKESDIVLGYVGRLHNVMKGTDDFVRTIASLPNQYRAIVIGDGQDRDALRQLAFDTGVDSRIHFLGSVDDPEHYYSAMDAILFTSRFEHFGLTPMEAIATDLPVFAFQCGGGFNEWADQDLMYLADHRDASVMAKHIHTSISSGEAYSQASRATTLLKERFSAAAMAEKVAGVYREIVAGH